MDFIIALSVVAVLWVVVLVDKDAGIPSLLDKPDVIDADYEVIEKK